jgi:hypothetical protein
MLPGPAVHLPLLHKPLEHSAALLQELPLGTLVAPSEMPSPGPFELPPPSSELPQAAAPKRLSDSANAASVE